MVEWLLLAGFATMAGGQLPRDLPKVFPVPSPRQLAWQKLETYAFVHFGPNTFTDREWGEGREDPKVFAPTQLDCRQWVRAFKDAGFKAVILTAKHHDGFCLWPSKQSTHTVAQSGWKGGKGDVLRELSDACREAGLKLGVYLSPWDRNHPLYGTPEYNEVFKNCLEEVLTGYGEVSEVWFDGANGEGPNGKRQVYDWPAFIDVVRLHAPNAVIFSDAGPDIRWVGNEAGYAGETNWSTLNRDLFVPGTPLSQQLTQGHEDGSHWVPAECDVSIRPGWFYHASQDGQVKSLEKLLDIYYGSVGRNGSMLLNVPPDRRGLIHETDVKRLREFKQALDRIFEHDLARGRPVVATGTFSEAKTYAAANATDGNPDTFWAGAAPRDGLTIELGSPQVFNRVVLQEAIAYGQRVKSFSIWVRVDGSWKPAFEGGTTIGAKRILRLPPVTADAVRLSVLDCKQQPTIASFELYCAPPEVIAKADETDFLEQTTVHLEADLPGCDIRYTLDGSTPNARSKRYEGPFTVDRTATVTALAFRARKSGLWPATLHLTRFDRSKIVGSGPPRPSLWPGLWCDVYDQGWQSLVDLDQASPTSSKGCALPSLDERTRDEHFALRFTGYLIVPKEGVYTFRLTSDDGSRLWIANRLVVDNDGLHGMEAKQGVIALGEGPHPFELAYFNATGGMGLEAAWRGPGFEERAFVASDFMRTVR
ncbi:MAG: alpha-L-fucosidase [Fimbriimonadaceae bacterium]|nr:alpha-L-fucosidase [Fimbriimonadaceae bacterium]